MKPKKDKLHLTIREIVKIKWQLRIYGYALINMEDVNLCSVIDGYGLSFAINSQGGFMGS